MRNINIDTSKSSIKLLLQILVVLVFIILGVYFIVNERAELIQVRSALTQANNYFVLAGGLSVFLFVVIQGWMYQYSFRALQKNITLKSGIILYLKRNVISIFIPAGTVTSMFFFNKEIERKHSIDRKQVLFASTIFSVSSIASSIIIAIPALVLLSLKGEVNGEIFSGIISAIIIALILIFASINIKNQGILFRYLTKKSSHFSALLSDLEQYSLKYAEVWKVLLLSLTIEAIGIVQLYIAMLALNLSPSVTVAFIGYALVIVILLSSPLLRGIGIIEFALTYALTLFGFSTVHALSVVFLFRFFEFWSVLLLGLIAFLNKKDHILFRVFPPILLFILGIVNIISAVTPAIKARLHALLELIPVFAIKASTWFILFSGFLLLMLSVYLFRGLKRAWLMAVVLTSFSFIAHLAKGIDYEEAIIALITLVFLIISRDQYLVKPKISIRENQWIPALMVLVSVLIFGTLGFYFINVRHFGTHFTVWESVQETVTAFFLVNIDLDPATRFGKLFLFSLHSLGLLTLVYWIYLYLHPYSPQISIPEDEERIRAQQLVTQYGRSNMDYFKVYGDKMFWFNEERTAFVSYKTSSDYAIVLGNPVGGNPEAIRSLIDSFEKECNKNGLRVAYHHIPESDLPFYRQFNKKAIPIGEEAVVQLNSFTVKGRNKSALRNAINKMIKAGYVFKINEPPQNDGFLQQLKAVSTEWLQDMKGNELVFSQGMFLENELKNQIILTVENSTGKIAGFINLIPNYYPGQANFDLMRKTSDAPPGTMDYLFVNMLEYLKEKGFESCTLGMVPLSGIDQPGNLQERALQTAYENMKAFAHYKNLYQFKEKFDPEWSMLYLVYSEPFDLLFVTNALKKVMEP